MTYLNTEAPSVNGGASAVSVSDDYSDVDSWLQEPPGEDLATFELGEFVDRSKVYKVNDIERRISPFTAFKKQPSFTSAGNLTGYGIEVANPKGEYDLIATVGPGYRVVPNIEIYNEAQTLMQRAPFEMKVARTFWDGKHFELYTEVVDKPIEVRVGDAVNFGFVFRNSYAGDQTLSVSGFLKRLACVNGMVSTRYFGHHVFRHDSKQIDGWRNELDQVSSIIENGPEFFGDIVRVMDNLQASLASEAQLRILMTDVVPGLGVTDSGKVLKRFFESEEPTYYGFLNAATHTFWHDARSASDFKKNDYVTTNLLKLAEELGADQ